MTTPRERTRAVHAIRLAIQDLAKHLTQRSEYLQIHRTEISRLSMLLRHYPTYYDINTSADMMPDTWARIGDEEKT